MWNSGDRHQEVLCPSGMMLVQWSTFLRLCFPICDVGRVTLILQDDHNIFPCVCRESSTARHVAGG